MNYDKEPELDVPSSPRRRRGVPVVLAVIIIIAALGWWLVERNDVPAPAAPSKVGTRLSDLEGRLQVIAEKLARLDQGAPAGTERRLVEEAGELQNELMRLRPVTRPEDVMRLAQWQARLGALNARDWSRQSLELEAASRALFRQGQAAAAVEKLKEALRLQREINVGPAGPELKDVGREARLEQEVERSEAEPLQDQGAQLLVQARDAVAAGRWTDALQLFSQARAIRLRLDRDYVHTRYNDLPAVDRIDAEMAALAANETHEQLENLVQQAAAAADARRNEQAARLLAAAAGRQRFINEQFPKSRFVSMERLEEIEIELQTVRAREPLAEVHSLDAAAAEHLRRRELFQAQQKIGSAVEKLEATIKELPKARDIDEGLRRRLSYLRLRQADLGPIQDQTYDRLLPRPGDEKISLLRTEVSQDLFARVMNANPSRRPGRELPVDSVTYGEAEEFCRRLGWVLGRPVRLPTEMEFRAAARDEAAPALGFRDLVGGLAEWLQADASDTAVVAGGAGAGQPPADLPLRTAPKTERARTNGLRVVVEVDLATLGER